MNKKYSHWKMCTINMNDGDRKIKHYGSYLCIADIIYSWLEKKHQQSGERESEGHLNIV